MEATHLKRWITGIIVVPALVAIILLCPEFVFTLLITFLVLVGVYEYNGMVFQEKGGWEKTEGFVTGAVIPLAAYFGGVPLMFAAVVFAFHVFFLLFLARIRQHPMELSSLMKVVFGYMYIPLMMSFFILLRSMEQGIIWVIFIVVMTFSSDISAYYTGKYHGKRKLYPAVSAKKTVEGALGSMVGTVAGAVLFKLIFFPELPLLHSLVLGFMGGTLGQLGDLCASSIKRISMVKDSGSFLPGHGGILDRLDSFIFIIPFVYFYAVLVIQ